MSSFSAHTSVMLSGGLTCASGAMATTPTSSPLKVAAAARPGKVKLTHHTEHTHTHSSRNKEVFIVLLTRF